MKAALAAITGERIRQHMSTLADDALEGRGPGTAGYEGALRYVESTIADLGLEPAGEKGTYRQRVPRRGATVVEAGS